MRNSLSTFSQACAGFSLVAAVLLSTPAASAQLRGAAPTASQQEVQSDLAERTKNLAEQYSNRRFGTEVFGEESADPVPTELTNQAIERRQQRLEASQTGTPDTYQLPDTPVDTTANTEFEPLAPELPNLPSSGFGISLVAAALIGAGARFGRKLL